MTKMTFQEHSIKTAERFLQTVVVVDDQAFYPRDSEKETEEKVSADEVATPDFTQAKPQASPQVEEPPPAVIETSPSTPVASDHSLNAKEMGDAFADRGLICTILRPELKNEETRETVITRTMTAAKRADVLILDWQNNDEEAKRNKPGQLTRDIIRGVLQDDDGRLRLIAIYTAEPKVESIVNSIENHLKENGFEPRLIGDDRSTLQIERARIEVYCKEAAPTRLQERRVSVADLPNRLITSFADMNGGLVSNFTVDAISALRENTYHLLSKLHKDLSGAYLVQRALAQPEDAFELLADVVSSELHSLISEHSIETNHVSAIEAWLDQEQSRLGKGLSYEEESRRYKAPTKYLQNLVAKNQENTTHLTLENISKETITRTIPAQDIRNWVLRGDAPNLPGFEKDKHYNMLPSLFCGTDASRRIAEFATLTTTRTRYGTNEAAPILTLGTIIEDPSNEPDGRFLLCIQPRCDSVRLSPDNPNPFLFLALQQKRSNGTFDFVMDRGGGDLIYLKLDKKASRWRILPFAPSDLTVGAVRAHQKDDGYFFSSKEATERSYTWVADLKEGYAQRIANQFASHVSRVGLNEMEWLRLSARRPQE